MVKKGNTAATEGALEKMYEKAKEQYLPEDTSLFVYAYHVVCAQGAENGEIFVDLCI